MFSCRSSSNIFLWQASGCHNFHCGRNYLWGGPRGFPPKRYEFWNSFHPWWFSNPQFKEVCLTLLDSKVSQFKDCLNHRDCYIGFWGTSRKHRESFGQAQMWYETHHDASHEGCKFWLDIEIWFLNKPSSMKISTLLSGWV